MRRLTRKQLAEILEPHVKVYIDSLPKKDYDEWWSTSRELGEAWVRGDFLEWLRRGGCHSKKDDLNQL